MKLRALPDFGDGVREIRHAGGLARVTSLERTLMVEEKRLDELRTLMPAQPRYFDRGREPGKLISTWNLVVPERVLNLNWEANE